MDSGKTPHQFVYITSRTTPGFGCEHDDPTFRIHKYTSSVSTAANNCVSCFRQTRSATIIAQPSAMTDHQITQGAESRPAAAKRQTFAAAYAQSMQRT